MQREGGGAGEEAGDPRHLWSASQTARYKDKSPPIAGGGRVGTVPPALVRLASGAGPLLGSRTDTRTQWPVAGVGDSSRQGGPESKQDWPHGLCTHSSRAAGRLGPSVSLPSPRL